MPKMMWQPAASQVASSHLFHFLIFVNNRYGYQLKDYSALHKWSVTEQEQFWESFWHFAKIRSSRPFDTVLLPAENMRATKWFPGARLNFAENLLTRRDDQLAIIFCNEQDQRQTYSYSELYQAVAKLALHLRALGVTTGDRVVAVLPNIPEAIIAMLATTSIGAIWSSCSPDFGKEALLDRFSQIKPKVLISCDGYQYNGKLYNNEEKIQFLRNKIPSIEHVLIKRYVTNQHLGDYDFAKLLTTFGDAKNLEFEQVPFDHPVYIMYSSGTTGMPKCIVHGAGGTLLQHLKELMLHTDVWPEDRIFYYTTCGWMMWNWYISSLALGATVVQYDGAVFYPTTGILFDFIAREHVSIFGTSAKYISSIEKRELSPKQQHLYPSLRTILSTGSPLVPSNFDYVYREIKADVCLSSISGGTDIISCFALGNPLLPVYRGELQCIGLGMDVKIFNEQGGAVISEKGELVCAKAFPSMPIYFWGDKTGEKYQQAYFERYPGVWAHGDFAEITPRETMIIYGRSDAVLNPGGVRIGTAEIYRQVEKIPEVTDSIAISQDYDDDIRIILFVVLRQDAELTQELCSRISSLIRENCSPRHVPAKIIAAPDIPRTLNGKLMELAVRDVINQLPVKNTASMANPECLEFFKHLEL